jgi:hypothetical protein
MPFGVEKLLIPFVAALVVALLAVASARARPDPKGWRALRPGAMHWTALLLGLGLSGLFLYVLLFVGSSRADAERQMAILFWLTLAFALGTLLAGLQTLATSRRRARWRGDTLAFRQGGAECSRRLDEVVTIGPSPFGMRLTFADGGAVDLDPYATGASELFDRVGRRLAHGGDKG